MADLPSATVTVYAPMKNEIGNVEEWVESVRTVADEIVVVDTGSTDGTYEKLQEMDGVKVYRSEIFTKDTPLGKFRFDEARNEALAKCKSEWIIAVDADERVSAKSPSWREWLVRMPDTCELVLCPVIFLRDNGTVSMKFFGERLFRNKPSIRYVGAMHNYVNAGKKGRVKSDFITVTSCRNKRSRESRLERCKQRIAMAEEFFIPAIEKNPKDTRSMFYLAKTYKEDRQYDKAIPWYERYLEHARWKPERYQAGLELAACYYRKKHYSKAEDTMGRVLPDNIRRAEGYVLLGKCAYVRKNYEDAAYWFEIATQKTLFEDQFFLERSAYAEAPWDSLSMSYYRLKKYDKAIAAAESILAMDVNDNTRKRVTQNIALFKKAMEEQYTIYEAEDYDEFWAKAPNARRGDKERLKKMLDCCPGYKRVLDIGCGPGWTLDVVEEGTEYCGVDISIVALDFVKKNGGDVASNLDHVRAGYWDVCILGEVIEHIVDDVDMLRSAASKVKDGGVMVVSVPGYKTMYSESHVRDYTHEEISGKLKLFGDVKLVEVMHPWVIYSVMIRR